MGMILLGEEFSLDGFRGPTSNARRFASTLASPQKNSNVAKPLGGGKM